MYRIVAMALFLACWTAGVAVAQEESPACNERVLRARDGSSASLDRAGAMSSLGSCPVTGPPALVELWRGRSLTPELVTQLGQASRWFHDARILSATLDVIRDRGAPRTWRQAAISAALGYCDPDFSVMFRDPIVVDGDSLGRVWIGHMPSRVRHGSVAVPPNAPTQVLMALREVASREESDAVLRSSVSQVLMKVDCR